MLKAKLTLLSACLATTMAISAPAQAATGTVSAITVTMANIIRLTISGGAADVYLIDPSNDPLGSYEALSQAAMAAYTSGKTISTTDFDCGSAGGVSYCYVQAATF